MRLACFIILVQVCLISNGSQYSISDLTPSTAPSTNTWIEVADLNATPKSRKYPIINLGSAVNAGYLTASLPSGVPVGFQTYCTDCLTPWGIGDRVEWDGSAWRTMRARIQVATSLADYVMLCTSNAVNIVTPMTDCYLQSTMGSTFYPLLLRSITSSGTGASVGPNIPGTNGMETVYATGTTTTGSGRSWGPFLTAIPTGGIYACGGQYAIQAVADGTDNYVMVIGMSQTVSTNYPVNGVFFLVDRYNATGHAQSYTNNYICVTGAASSYSFADSGLVAQANVKNRLAVQLESGAARFYTNGVLCAAISTTLPASTLSQTYVEILKTSGNTSRQLSEYNPWWHNRRPGNRSF